VQRKSFEAEGRRVRSSSVGVVEEKGGERRKGRSVRLEERRTVTDERESLFSVPYSALTGAMTTLSLAEDWTNPSRKAACLVPLSVGALRERRRISSSS
jgi:hypothetical protein